MQQLAFQSLSSAEDTSLRFFSGRSKYPARAVCASSSGGIALHTCQQSERGKQKQQNRAQQAEDVFRKVGLNRLARL